MTPAPHQIHTALKLAADSLAAAPADVRDEAARRLHENLLRHVKGIVKAWDEYMRSKTH